MYKIFQETPTDNPINKDVNITIFLLTLLLKENNGELKINSVITENLSEYGIEFDTTDLKPNQPLILKLCKKE